MSRRGFNARVGLGVLALFGMRDSAFADEDVHDFPLVVYQGDEPMGKMSPESIIGSMEELFDVRRQDYTHYRFHTPSDRMDRLALYHRQGMLLLENVEATVVQITPQIDNYIREGTFDDVKMNKAVATTAAFMSFALSLEQNVWGERDPDKQIEASKNAIGYLLTYYSLLGVIEREGLHDNFFAICDTLFAKPFPLSERRAQDFTSLLKTYTSTPTSPLRHDRLDEVFKELPAQYRELFDLLQSQPDWYKELIDAAGPRGDKIAYKRKRSTLDMK